MSFASAITPGRPVAPTEMYRAASVPVRLASDLGDDLKMPCQLCDREQPDADLANELPAAGADFLIMRIGDPQLYAGFGPLGTATSHVPW